MKYECERKSLLKKKILFKKNKAVVRNWQHDWRDLQVKSIFFFFFFERQIRDMDCLNELRMTQMSSLKKIGY
jgi:hypothetical protein